MRLLTLLISSILLTLSGMATASHDELIVYSARKEHLIKPLFDAYTEQSGIKIRYITDKAGPLLQRLKAEGRRTRADILMTVDAGNLWHAANEGVLSTVKSQLLMDNVPAHLRDTQGRWFGLSIRARTIVYNQDRVADGELTTYEDLADSRWKGRLCLRTSKKVYNQSLVATMISRMGEEKTEAIVRGWVDNLAMPVFSNDTKTMKAIAAGRCDAGIVNTYYFGRLQKKEPDTRLALFWPNQQTSGVHVNISGAGVTRHSHNKKEAVKLLEWLTSAKAQKMIAGMNMEYPINDKHSADEQVLSWGTFKADDIDISEAGRLQAQAVKLMDRAGYR